MPCPRRDSLTPVEPGTDIWRKDWSCSHCGSLHPGVLMDRLEAGTIELGPTDKNYKVYVYNHGGEQLMPIKFYFEHLASAQRDRFIELMNEKKLLIGEPGFFYNVPFFMQWSR